MSLELHRQVEQLMSDAEELERRGLIAEAQVRYGQAAAIEVETFNLIPLDRPRTRGIVAVGAVSLYWRAGDFVRAQREAHRFLLEPAIPDFAIDQIWEMLLEAKQEEKARSEGRTMSGQLIEVSLRGGSVGLGVAPFELVMTKFAQWEKLLERAVEWTAGLPFRTTGTPSPWINRLLKPTLSEASAGSYRFKIGLQTPRVQLAPAPLFGDVEKIETVESSIGLVNPRQLIDATVRLMGEVNKPVEERLATMVPAKMYRDLFVKTVRNMAPQGQAFDEMEVKRVGVDTNDVVILNRESRHAISEYLRVQSGNQTPETVRRGVLRALDLNKAYIVLTDAATRAETRCSIREGAIFDDIVGPMVNHSVTVYGRLKGNSFLVSDIELNEEESE